MDIQRVRADFPILTSEINGHELVYLDNAATMQMPEPVLNAVVEHYHTRHANIHRGIHTLSEASTHKVEEVRKQVQRFINAPEAQTVIFTSGTTQSLNFAASGFARSVLKPGDTVLVTAMEHHSNLSPWQDACARTGAGLKIIPITDDGDVEIGAYRKLLEQNSVRVVSVAWVSNVLGTVNPIDLMASMAHDAGAAFVVDAAQGMKHEKIDVQKIGCDFLACSGHKLGAPTGVGVLWGTREWLERLGPVQFGGGMVDHVTYERTTVGDLPFAMEAGTSNISGIVGLGAALDYLETIGIDDIARQEAAVLASAEQMLEEMPGVEVLGHPRNRVGCISFVPQHLACYDVATLLDKLGIAVRSGHHCAEPLMGRYGVNGTVRISPSFYNTTDEIEAVGQGLEKISKVAGKIA